MADDEGENEKTQIFLAPGTSAKQEEPPQPAGDAHEVVLKPSKQADDTSRTAVDFDITGGSDAPAADASRGVDGGAPSTVAPPTAAPAPRPVAVIVIAAAAVAAAVAGYLLTR